MNKIITKIITIALFVTIKISIIESVNASSAIPSLEPTGSIGSPKPETIENTVGNIASTITEWLFIIAGILAVCAILWYGIKYIASGGDTNKTGEAKKAVLDVVIGVIIATAVYSIIKFATSIGAIIQNAIN